MNWLDVFGHISYLFLVGGVFLLSKKNKYGWLCHILGGSGWTIIGFMANYTSLWFWGIIFLILDSRGYWLWTKMEKDYDDKN